MAKVVLEKLEKVYPQKAGPGVRAVKGIDLTIEDREFMILVGPSGCGKSTTLRMIAGLEEVSGGRIWIDGKLVNEVPPKDRDIAMVFQNYALYPHMTARENMAFGLKLRGFRKAEIEARVQEASSLLGLDGLLERRPKELSGGQRQRVAVGRAIVRKPKVFLFDEPLSNLDAKMRVAMRAEISQLHARLDATMIYVTHDQTEAMTMGDRICVMNDGRIGQVAEPLCLYLRPANLFVAGFIGSPPMNLLRGTAKLEGDHVLFEQQPSGSHSLRIQLTGHLEQKARNHIGRGIVLGIRPEDLSQSEGRETGLPLIEASVELVEPMGAETYLHLSTNGASLVARVRPSCRPSLSERVRLVIGTENARLFDQESGLAL